MSQAAPSVTPSSSVPATAAPNTPPAKPRGHRKPKLPVAGPLGIVSLDDKTRDIGRLINRDGTPGGIVFVEGTLPGEWVMYRGHCVKSSYEQVSVVNILRQSTSRVTPQCKFFGVCGGCSIQHLDSRIQVAIKQRVLEDDLQHLAKLHPDVVFRPIAGPDWGYHHHAYLIMRHVATKGGILVGLHKRESSYMTDMTSCKVLPPHVFTLLVPLHELVNRLSIVQRMPQIGLAVGQDVTTLVLHNLELITAGDEAELRVFADHHNIQFWLRPKGPSTIYPSYPLNRALAYTLPEFGITIPFRPTDLTQVSHRIDRVLASRALKLLNAQPGNRLLDLFCGIGNFTLPMVMCAREVMGVRGSEALTTCAFASAQHNGLDAKTKFVCHNLFGVITDDIAALGKFDRWLVDPPREGAPAMSKALAELSQHDGEEADLLPKRIVYVSCSPATLIRDVDLLVYEADYRLADADVVNVLPHTSHVESMAVLERD